MGLKFRITKAAHAKLSEELQAEYEADGDAHFKLQVTGLEEPAELRRAKERAESEAEELREERDTLLAQTKKDKKAIDKLEASQTDEGRDARKIEDRYQKKIVTITEEKDGLIASRDAFIRSSLVDNQAMALAREISTVPDLLAKTLRERMDVDFSGDKPVLVIKDKDGKPDPKATIDTLKTETLANPAYKPILAGSKATGSATQKGNLAGSGATFPPNTDAKTDPMTLSGPELAARLKSKADARQAAHGGAQ